MSDEIAVCELDLACRCVFDGSRAEDVLRNAIADDIVAAQIVERHFARTTACVHSFRCLCDSYCNDIAP